LLENNINHILGPHLLYFESKWVGKGYKALEDLDVEINEFRVL